MAQKIKNHSPVEMEKGKNPPKIGNNCQNIVNIVIMKLIFTEFPSLEPKIIQLLITQIKITDCAQKDSF